MVHVLSVCGEFEAEGTERIRTIVEEERVDGFNDVWLDHGGEGCLPPVTRVTPGAHQCS